MNGAATKGDWLAVGTSLLAYFKLIPWPELAACAAFIYTVLRIAQLVTGWFIKRKKA